MMPMNDDTQNQESQDTRFPNLPRPLTRQELHVLELLGQGYTNEDIARTLDIAVSTVSSHVQHILKKLQVRNRVEAVLYIRHYGAQISPLRATDSTSNSRQHKKSTRRIPLSLHDPLLFLSQLNHVNWRIAQQGALHIDYFGMTGAVSLAFYDPYTQQLKVHLSICSTFPGEINAEVDELLWKYILEVAELSSDVPYPPPPPSPKKQSPLDYTGAKIDISDEGEGNEGSNGDRGVGMECSTKRSPRGREEAGATCVRKHRSSNEEAI